MGRKKGKLGRCSAPSTVVQQARKSRTERGKIGDEALQFVEDFSSFSFCHFFFFFLPARYFLSAAPRRPPSLPTHRLLGGHIIARLAALAYKELVFTGLLAPCRPTRDLDQNNSARDTHSQRPSWRVVWIPETSQAYKRRSQNQKETASASPQLLPACIRVALPPVHDITAF